MLIKNLKLGLTPEEIDLAMNSFDNNAISADMMEKKLLEASQRVENLASDKQMKLAGFQSMISEAIARERILVDRLFFDFDKQQTGMLELHEFTAMLQFLKINANKNQIRF